MNKHFKMMAVLSAAGFLTAAAPELGLNFTAADAYAKVTGWVEENGSFKFYEDEEYYATDAWKKRGEDWYYLNEDGEIATNTQIDEYYVDETGKRVSDKWVAVDNEDYWDSPDEAEYHWYYYGKNGKAVVSRWQNVGGQFYYFNDQGQMMTGKITLDDGTYYLGDETDGVMKTGWIQLENENDYLDETHSWHYFDKNGRMIENQVDKKIEGDYYTFVDGVMQTGWFKLPAQAEASGDNATPSEAAQPEADEPSVRGYQYYDSETGKRVNGWREMEGPEGISAEGEIFTFYFKNGAPYYAEKGLELFTVDSKKYAFNTKGEMQTGLKVVNLEDGGIANFYFGTDGVMKTGKQTIYNENLDENQIWYFHTDGSRKGQGLHGVRDNTLYEYGLRKEADADLKLEPVAHEGKDYLVNVSGGIQKASSNSKSSEKPELGAGFKDYKDANGKVWVVDVNGIIQ